MMRVEDRAYSLMGLLDVNMLSEYLGATWQTHKTDYTSYYI